MSQPTVPPTGDNDNNSPRQLSIFEPQFDERIRRIVIDGVTHFSILDILQHFGSEGSAKNPATYWARSKKRLEKQGSDLTGLLDWRPDGQNGGKPTPMVTLKFFLRIVQSLDIREWEIIRDWMAQTAHERIEEIANPALGVDRANKRYIEAQTRRGITEAEAVQALRDRLDSIDAFKLLMDSVATKVDAPVKIYGTLVNVEYKSIFGKIASELRLILNTKSIRDALPPMMLSYIRTAELTCQEVYKHAERLTGQEALDIMRDVALPLGQQLQKTCERLGIDHITGKPLLAKGTVSQ